MSCAAVDSLSKTNFDVSFLLLRLDSEEYEKTDDGVEPRYVSMQHGQDTNTRTALLKTEFNIPSDRILRIRNKNGSLINIGSNLKLNIQSEPYKLEVVKMHQTVKPSPRSVKMSSYNETLKKKLDSILNRILSLEKATPDLCLKRNARIKTETEDLEHKVLFLHKRFDQADGTSWKGMFKKQPFW